jgi:hypothetical protein
MATRSIVGLDGRPAVFFTEHSHQVLSTCAHLLGLSILSCCISHRAPSLRNWREWANLTWSRWSVILVLLDSWLFVFFTGVLVNGVGLSSSPHTCALAIYACISFYVLSKVLIYGFLVEKVYYVWSSGKQTPRFRTPAYRICSVVLLGYVTILALMILGQNSWIRGDGMCIIGLKSFASLPTIGYDLFLNVFLTGMFLWPLWHSTTMTPVLRKVAIRTLYGACASLITSAANIAILTALRGTEYGWACLGSCVTDVALNAMALSWVTAGSNSRSVSPLRGDQYPPATTFADPVTLVQSNFEPGKETDYRGTATFQSARDIPSPQPESFHDPTPGDQASKPGSGAGGSKGLFWSLRAALSHAQEPSDAATLVATPTVHLKQLSSRSEEVSNPISRTLQQETPDSDIMGRTAQPFSNDVALGNEPYSRRRSDSNTEGERNRHGFIGRFRSLFSERSPENTDDDLELDFAKPDDAMGYATSPTPRNFSTYGSPNYDNQCNADLPQIYEEFRRPYPPEKHVRVLNRFVTRMPTIESLGSKEVGSAAHSIAHSSSMYATSSGCYDEEASLKSTGTQTTTHSTPTATSDTPYHTGSEPLSRSLGSIISHGSIGGMNKVREEEEEGGREFVSTMEPEDWEHGWDSSTSESHSVTSYSTATNSGSPCQSLNISAGHFGQSNEELAS